MFRQRFCWISVLAMLVTAAFAVLVMVKTQGDGFGGHLGFPFAWYYWPDVIVDGRVPGAYSWIGLIADVAFWLSLIFALGLFVERIASRQHARRASRMPPNTSLERTREG